MNMYLFLIFILIYLEVRFMKISNGSNLNDKYNINSSCNKKLTKLIKRYSHLLELYNKLKNKKSPIILHAVIPCERVSNDLEQCRKELLKFTKY
jgi:hypothetical protein